MNVRNNVDILGIGVYLPEQIRENNWWSEDIVKKWADDKRRFSSSFDINTIDLEDLSPEARILIETLHELKRNTDTFEGSKRRYIMSEQQKTSDMEIAAAGAALKNAGVSPSKIDFVLTQSTLPDIICDPNACIVHKALNLKNSCFSQEVLGMCNAFLQQLFLAKSFIESGNANYGLLIQSSGMSRLLEHEHPSAPFFGDGATAVVVGPTSTKQGVFSVKHNTHGGLGTYFTNGIPGKCWYEDGRIRTYVSNITSGPMLNFHAVEQSKILVEAALEEANLQKSDIQFYAGHQGMSWFRQVTQKAIGLESASTHDTFGMHASLVGANIPLVLYYAMQNNLLKKGDNIAAFSPGSGMTATGMVMKWGI